MYTRPQKESSSTSSTSINKKSNNSEGSHSFSVQRLPEINSSQEKERPSYSRNAADLLAANVMRSMAAREQGEEAPGAASVTQAEVASVFQPLGEMSSGAGVQAKLTVGPVGDKYEQEADRVAAQVMRMSIPPENSPQVQRFGEEDNPVQRWSLAQSITPVVHRRVDEQVQMRQLVQRAFQAGGNQASGDLESRLNASQGGGKALAPEVRAFMEPRFGADFSSVRVHTGSEAVQMNRELGAQAFTHGSDVYFGAGKSPGNNELTAHELTHVVQQNGGAVQCSRLNSPQQLSESIVQRDDIPGDGEDLANGTQPEEMLDGPFDNGEVEQRPKKRQRTEEPIQTKRESGQLVFGQKEDSIQRSENEQPNLWARTSSPDHEVPFWGRNTTDSSENGSLVIQRVTTRNNGKQNVDYSKQMQNGGGGGHPPVPKNKWQTRVVNGKNYKFWNEADGTLEFTAPKAGGGPAVVPVDTVNIDAGGGKLIHTGRSLKNTRYQHFLAANIDYEGKNPPAQKGYSPPGLTWHHHKTQGLMELIDRDVHGAFGHHGGFSIWGS